MRLYGKMPTKKDLLQNKLKVSNSLPYTPTNLTAPVQERKYFDSGDYALSKAGKASDVGVTNIGSRHPVPENIPHLTATSPGANNPAAASNNGGSPGSQGQQIPGSISGHPGSVGFLARSPTKESSFLHQGTSADDSGSGTDSSTQKDKHKGKEASTSPPPVPQGVPIRR